MDTYEVEIRINSSVVVLIDAENLDDAKRQAQEMCDTYQFGDNVPEVDNAYVDTIYPPVPF